MTFNSLIKSISNDFTKAWNEWDTTKLRELIYEHAIITSPMIVELYPELNTNQLVGREKILDYWAKLKKEKHTSEVVQESFVKEDIYIRTINKIVGTEQRIFETLQINEYGKIKEMHYEYDTIRIESTTSPLPKYANDVIEDLHVNA